MTPDQGHRLMRSAPVGYIRRMVPIVTAVMLSAVGSVWAADTSFPFAPHNQSAVIPVQQCGESCGGAGSTCHTCEWVDAHGRGTCLTPASAGMCTCYFLPGCTTKGGRVIR